MDFSNEKSVRLYTRNSTTWMRLGWEGQCVLMQVLRIVDRAGVLDIEDMEPAAAVSLHTGMPIDTVRAGMARVLELGPIEHRGTTLIIPRFMEAQECAQSDKQRQRESRERRRDLAKAQDEVTNRDEKSQAVTDGHSVLCCADLNCAVPSENARAREARFERPSLPEPPPELSPAEPPPLNPEARAWRLYQRMLGTEHLMLPMEHHEALRKLAGAAK